MEENKKSLKKQQAWVSAPKMHLVCLLYAIFYTFCLYHNRSGITVPFYIGVTLWFFGCYFRRSGVTAAKGNTFWKAAMILLGIISFTTDSDVIITWNRLLGIVLMGVWLLQTVLGEQTEGWRVGTWCRELLALFCGSIGRIGAPFADAAAYRKEQHTDQRDEEAHRRKRRIAGAVLIGIVISIPILFIVGLLLLSADMVFFEMFCNMFRWMSQWHVPEWLLNGDLFGVILMTVVCFLYTYGMLVYCRQKQAEQKTIQQECPQWDAYIAMTAAVLITVLYLLFCGVQIFGLFLGKMQLPAGYTYAEYARSGFFPLLFVCLFNICLVPACHAFFARSRVLDVLLTIICGCTYIMIASSAFRMLLYIGSYGMTFLRFSVLWTLVVMVLLTAGMIYNIYHEKFGLFRYLLVIVTLGYLGFAMIHPDYWIARYDILAMQKGEATDAYYLQTRLSADAAPAIAAMDQYGISEDICNVDFVQREYFDRIEENKRMHIRDWNVSRAIAHRYAQKAVVH